MRTVLLLALTAPLGILASEDLRVMHIAPGDAAVLEQAWRAKQQADQEWERLASLAYQRYVTTPALATMGDRAVEVPSILHGWEYGIDSGVWATRFGS